MKAIRLLERLIYLDTEFISRLYEQVHGVSPQTVITSTKGVEANMSAGFFSGGGASSESRAFSVSTIKMLEQLKSHLDTYQEFDQHDLIGSTSRYRWVNGNFGTSRIKLSKQRGSMSVASASDEVIAEEDYFMIKSASCSFALAPTEQYFVSGIASFRGLTHVVIDQLSMPCRALLRIFSGKTTFGEWIATPLVILDSKEVAN
jgi:hypothetical protein